MSQWTDDELNRVIAEHLEPVAELEAIQHFQCSATCALDHALGPDISPKRFWVLKTRPRWHWAPAYNFCQDWNATGMLLEKLGSMGDIQIIGIGEHWQVRHLGPSPECHETVVDANPLQRAICEAFVKSFQPKGG